MNYVLTGRAVDNDGVFVERNLLVARMRRVGWNVQAAVDFQTHILVAADAALDRGTRKVQAARSMGIEVIPYLRLFNRLEAREREQGLPPFRVHVPEPARSPGPRTSTRDYPTPTGRLGTAIPAFQEIEPPPPWYSFSRYITWRPLGWSEDEFDLVQDQIEECELFVQYQVSRDGSAADAKYRVCTLTGWHERGDLVRWMLNGVTKGSLMEFMSGMIISVREQMECERRAREEREAEEERQRIEAMTFRPKVVKRQLGFD